MSTTTLGCKANAPTPEATPSARPPVEVPASPPAEPTIEVDLDLDLPLPEHGFVQVALGPDYGCARSSGKAGCWTGAIADPIEVDGVPWLADLAVGARMACTLSLEWGVALKCWVPGDDAEPEAISVANPVRLLAQPTAAQVCAADREGALYCWSSPTDTPTRLELEDVREIVFGAEQLCALTHAGRILCGATNDLKELRALPWLDGVSGLHGITSNMVAWNDKGQLWTWDPRAPLDIADFRRPRISAGVHQAGTTGSAACALRLEPGADAYSAACQTGPETSVRLEGLDKLQTLATGPGLVCATTVLGELGCWAQASDGSFGEVRELNFAPPDPAKEARELAKEARELSEYYATLPTSLPRSCPVKLTRAKTRHHPNLAHAANEVLGPGTIDEAEDDLEDVVYALCDSLLNGAGYPCDEQGPWYGGEYWVHMFVPDDEGEGVTQLVNVTFESPGMEDLSVIEEWDLRSRDPLDVYIHQTAAERGCERGRDDDDLCGLQVAEVTYRVFTRDPETGTFLRLELVRDPDDEQFIGDAINLDWHEGKLIVSACNLDGVVLDPRALLGR